MKFRKFVSVTQGTTISITSDIEGLPMLQFDILEAKPPNPFKSVCMINTDVEIDFAAPLDYIEPARPIPKLQKKTSSQNIEEEGEDAEFRAFRGNYQRLDGKTVK